MWMKNMYPFVGLKIVPEIIAEMNENGQTLTTACKDVEEEVIRPKPRRLDSSMPCALSQSSAVKPFRRLRGTTSLPPEREAGCEILDILIMKANSGSLTSHYIGSPPCRAGNPLIHDAHFNQKRASASASPSPVNHPSALCGGNASMKSSSSRGLKSFVRIEGFMPSSGELQPGIPAFA